MWEGSSLQDVLRSMGTAAAGDTHSSADLHQQQQHGHGAAGGVQRVHDALVAHPTCFTGGLGLDAWQYEDCVTATATVNIASQRNQGMYGFAGPRCVLLRVVVRMCGCADVYACMHVVGLCGCVASHMQVAARDLLWGGAMCVCLACVRTVSLTHDMAQRAR